MRHQFAAHVDVFVGFAESFDVDDFERPFFLAE